MTSSRTYWIAVTSRVSACRLSLIEAITLAPPGIVPRNDVPASSGVNRLSSQPLSRLVARMNTTANVKMPACWGMTASVFGEKPAPSAVPIIACPAM